MIIYNRMENFDYLVYIEEKKIRRKKIYRNKFSCDFKYKYLKSSAKPFPLTRNK